MKIEFTIKPIHKALLAMLLSAGAGFEYASNQGPQEINHVPAGQWALVIAVNNASYQVDVDQVSDPNPQIRVMWIREDRTFWFHGQLDVIGKTIISRVAVDCENEQYGVLEQRSFGPDMKYVTTVSRNKAQLKDMEDPLGIAAGLAACDSDESDSSQEPSKPYHPEDDGIYHPPSIETKFQNI